MSNFRPVDRDTGFLMPPSVDEWLPEKHLARFVVDVIAGLDLRAMLGSYRGSGEAPYHPSVLLGILVYGYATGVFSSRKLERATYDSVAFRFVAANQHPDHDTIATFRRRFLDEIQTLFVEVLQLAREIGVLKLGTIALDGTKIHANASRHSALSYEHAGRIEAQLQAEVAELMAKAEAADQADVPDGMSIPEELALRNWPGASSVWPRLPGPGQSLRRGRRNGMPVRRLSTTPKWQRAKPRPRPRARSLAAGRPRRRWPSPARPTKST
jgi:transposase